MPVVRNSDMMFNIYMADSNKYGLQSDIYISSRTAQQISSLFHHRLFGVFAGDFCNGGGAPFYVHFMTFWTDAHL